MNNKLNDSVPSPLLDAIISFKFTLWGFWKTNVSNVGINKIGEKHALQKLAPTFSFNTNSSSSSDEAQSSAALLETLRGEE